MSLEFKAFPKIPRLNRGMVVTEKIDGTNAAVIILDVDEVTEIQGYNPEVGDVTPDGVGIVVPLEVAGSTIRVVVAAQSRKRLISPGKQTDNAGFAGWVRANAQALADALGPGYHYGEWWGKSIQRGYGLDAKRFSLFNVYRYRDMELPEGVDLVPLLHQGQFDVAAIQACVDDLRENGSKAAPGQVAEGVVVFHEASGNTYKVLCENDELPKGVVPRQEREATRQVYSDESILDG